VKLLRQGIIPVIAVLVLAVNTASQQTLRDIRWAVWLGAALIVVAGLLGVGKKWMYFVFPFAVSIFFLIFNLWRNYSEATTVVRICNILHQEVAARVWHARPLLADHRRALLYFQLQRWMALWIMVDA
jgi:energy-coupling factor transporter transmembrane protein EcfT